MVRNDYWLEFISAHLHESNAVIAAHLGCDKRTVSRYRERYINGKPKTRRQLQGDEERSKAGCMPYPNCLKHLFQ